MNLSLKRHNLYDFSFVFFPNRKMEGMDLTDIQRGSTGWGERRERKHM
jgi:hypothetical protein